MSYRDGARQYVPPGYIRLDVAREKIGVDALRDKLATGSLLAFEICDENGELKPILKSDWISERGTGMLFVGYSAHQFYKYSNGWRTNPPRDMDTARLIVIKEPAPPTDAETASPSKPTCGAW
jgi:hypothetical protein